MLDTTGENETVVIKAGNKWEATTVGYLYPNKLDLTVDGAIRSFSAKLNEDGYRVRVVLDFTGASPVANVYLNNRLIGSVAVNSSYSPYTTLFFGSTATAGCSYYIDNARVYYYSE